MYKMNDSAVIVVVLMALALFFLLMHINTLHTQQRRDVSIEKTKTGYDIYKDNELMYEFTKQNCDSMSLETLKMIYEGD